jgi:hypothetical protein
VCSYRLQQPCRVRAGDTKHSQHKHTIIHTTGLVFTHCVQHTLFPTKQPQGCAGRWRPPPARPHQEEAAGSEQAMTLPSQPRSLQILHTVIRHALQPTHVSP